MTILTQLKREISTFFFSPIGYVLIGVAAILNGIVFMLIADFLSDPRAPHGAAMQMLFGGTIFFWIIVLVLTPLITMRSLAEEKHSGTLETLLTAPINDFQVVLAKFLAAVVFYAVMWLPTVTYPILLSKYAEIELGPLFSGYLGTLGVGMMFLSIGLLCSALTKNQIIAALLSFAGIMVLFILGIFEFIGEGSSSGSILGYMNLWAHMEDFGRGIVDTRHLIYYGSIILISLFAAVQALQSRRWK